MTRTQETKRKITVTTSKRTTPPGMTPDPNGHQRHVLPGTTIHIYRTTNRMTVITIPDRLNPRVHLAIMKSRIYCALINYNWDADGDGYQEEYYDKATNGRVFYYRRWNFSRSYGSMGYRARLFGKRWDSENQPGKLIKRILKALTTP